MYSTFTRSGLVLLAVALVVADTRAQPSKDAPSSPAAIKKALDQKITLDFQTQDLNEAIEHLHQKTKIHFVVDNRFLFLNGGPIPGAPGTQINLKIDNGKIKTALQGILTQFQLTYVILGNSVFITSPDFAIHQQMSQRVTVDVTGVPLDTVIKQLAEDTAVNLVMDPRQTDKAKTRVTLELEDVTLETAVRLLTEIAGLNSARVGNVLFITSDERAEKLRKELPPPNHNVNPFDPLMPRFGIAGGFMPGIGGLGGPPRPPVVVPPAKEPPLRLAPPKTEPGKPDNQIDPAKQQLDVVLMDPQDDVQQLKEELKRKDIELKKLQRQLEEGALALEQTKKEAIRLQQELKSAQNERDAAVARVSDLFEKLKVRRPQMQALAKQLANKEGDTAPPNVNSPSFKNPPAIKVDGTIETVDKTLVKISLGADHGVLKDHTLEVYRLKPEPKYLGRILVVDADFRHSLARFIVQTGVPMPTLMPGDLVTSKLE
jgi:type II secretory pathway component GspD/PulD (secretin)